MLEALAVAVHFLEGGVRSEGGEDEVGGEGGGGGGSGVATRWGGVDSCPMHAQCMPNARPMPHTPCLHTAMPPTPQCPTHLDRIEVEVLVLQALPFVLEVPVMARLVHDTLRVLPPHLLDRGIDRVLHLLLRLHRLDERDEVRGLVRFDFVLVRAGLDAHLVRRGCACGPPA